MSEPTTVIAGGEAVEYRDVPGFPGYRVGTDGSVWSCRTSKGVRSRWRRLKAGVHRGNVPYLVVNLWRQNKGFTWYVHRLVLSAFRGDGRLGEVACHIDGDPQNNRLKNLRWGTRVDNEQDKDRHGRRRRGESHQNARLTLAQVREIRRLRRAGLTHSRIAGRFGMPRRTVSHVLNGTSWKNQH